MPKAKQQGPKLRTSCNNCSSAKVRCGKPSDASADSPTCVRCTQQNLECVYDFSQRKGKPFQPYPKSKPTNVAQNMGNGEEQQNLDDNSSNKPDNVAQTVHNGEGQQNSDFNNNNTSTSSSRTTNKDNAYPWPKTGWNLSDVGPEIDFSSKSQNPSGEFRVALPLKHDICSIISNLRSHLFKLEKLLDSTHGSDISKRVADQYISEFRTIRATIQQLLSCECHLCDFEHVQVFLLATLSLNLSESYRNILMNLHAALAEVSEEGSKIANLSTFALSLKPELVQFSQICHLIREKGSQRPEFKAVGEAYYETLSRQKEGYSLLLNSWLGNAAAHLRRLENPFPVNC